MVKTKISTGKSNFRIDVENLMSNQATSLRSEFLIRQRFSKISKSLISTVFIFQIQQSNNFFSGTSGFFLKFELPKRFHRYSEFKWIETNHLLDLISKSHLSNDNLSTKSMSWNRFSNCYKIHLLNYLKIHPLNYLKIHPLNCLEIHPMNS